MNTADSLASGALGLALAALTWLVAHSAQLKKVLDLLPSLAADAAKAKATVDAGGVAPVVRRVEADLSAEAQAQIAGLIARLEAVAAPMAEPAPAATTPAASESAPQNA